MEKINLFDPPWQTDILLPVELHYPILDAVIHHGDQATLLACAMACHTWLQRCKAALFKSITVVAPTELARLLPCLNFPSSFLVRHVRRICVVQDESHQPWGHAMLADLGNRLPHVQELSFRVRGNQGVGHIQPRFSTFSAHPTMPSLLPSLFSAFGTITKLQLTNYCFRSFTDILRLVSALPSLEDLGCEKLWWNHIAATPPQLARTGHKLVKVRLKECRDTWPFLWLWAAPATTSTTADSGFPGLNETDVLVAGEMGRNCTSLAATTYSDMECRQSEDKKIWILQMSDVHFSQSVQFHFVAEPKEDSLLRRRSVYKIILEDPSSHLREIYRWEKVDEFLSRLPHLDSVVVDVVYTQSDTADNPSILNEFVDLMPLTGHKISVKDGVCLWQLQKMHGGKPYHDFLKPFKRKPNIQTLSSRFPPTKFLCLSCESLLKSSTSTLRKVAPALSPTSPRTLTFRPLYLPQLGISPMLEVPPQPSWLSEPKIDGCGVAAQGPRNVSFLKLIGTHA